MTAGLKPLVGKLVNNQWHATGAHDFDSRTSGEYFLYSDDDGDTWNTNQDGELWIMHDWNSMFSGVNESCMAEVAPGRLLVFMRNQLGRLFQAWSNDNGDTWTRPAADRAGRLDSAAAAEDAAQRASAVRVEPGIRAENPSWLRAHAVVERGQPRWRAGVGVFSEHRVDSRNDAGQTATERDPK